MLKTYSLKAALSDLQEAISKIETIIHDYEEAELDMCLTDIENLLKEESNYEK